MGRALRRKPLSSYERKSLSVPRGSGNMAEPTECDSSAVSGEVGVINGGSVGFAVAPAHPWGTVQEGEGRGHTPGQTAAFTCGRSTAVGRACLRGQGWQGWLEGTGSGKGAFGDPWSLVRAAGHRPVRGGTGAAVCDRALGPRQGLLTLLEASHRAAPPLPLRLSSCSHSCH